ncbi:hypothetical protein [Streptomyces sp. NPDC057413]|uniref:hypothetical protein n=1 Tax=Streptomyces sp. NPDC057413 TaxID=3346124 RepID=UPI00367E774B
MKREGGTSMASNLRAPAPIGQRVLPHPAAAGSPVEDQLYARLRMEATPTGEYFRTRTPAGPPPLTPEQQRRNYELLATVSRRPHTAPDHDRTPIRALTIRPPYSDLIAFADDQVAKRIENRVWATSWRGTLLIHAGSSINTQALAQPQVQAALPAGHQLVVSAIVAIADLVDIHADDGACAPWSMAGHFHWRLERVQRLTVPVPALGAQRLWRPAPKLLRKITAANPHLSGRLARAEAA